MCTFTSGCYDSNEISQLAFIIAVGIDNADDGLYDYTFQAVKPSAFEGESDSNPLVTTTVTASSVYTAMDKLNTEISEKCDYSHIKLAVFSPLVKINIMEIEEQIYSSCFALRSIYLSALFSSSPVATIAL